MICVFVLFFNILRDGFAQNRPVYGGREGAGISLATKDQALGCDAASEIAAEGEAFKG